MVLPKKIKIKKLNEKKLKIFEKNLEADSLKNKSGWAPEYVSQPPGGTTNVNQNNSFRN